MFRLRYIFHGVLLFIGLWLILFNLKVPLLPGDDYLYLLKFPEEGYPGYEKINSISDFISSVINHYRNYNNRIAPHALLQAILLLPGFVFDILNALVYLILPLIILEAFPKIKDLDRVKIYTTVLALTWIFHPDLGRAYFWTSGAINYSWLLIPQLYYSVRLIKKFGSNLTFQIKDVLIALLICTSNEHIVLCLFIISGFLFFKERNGLKKTDKHLFVSAAILFFGGTVMLCSPALFVRFHDATQTHGWSNTLLLENLNRIFLYCIYILANGLILLLFEKKLLPGKQGYIAFAMILLSLTIMFFTPLFEPRAAVFPYYLSFVFYLSCSKTQQINSLAIAFILLLAFAVTPSRWSSAVELDENMYKLEKALSSAKTKTDSAYLSKICIGGFNNAIPCEDVYYDPEHLHNKSLSSYFDISFVVRKKPSACWKMDVPTDSLSKSNKLLESGGINLTYHKAEPGNLCMSLVLDKIDPHSDTTFILRGAKNSVGHKLLRILPESYRIYFLDYLEDDFSIEEINDQRYLVLNIRHPKKYAYFILSAYSITRHKAIGQTILINNPVQ